MTDYSKLVDDLHESKLWASFEELAYEVSCEALDEDREPEIIRILNFLEIEMGPEVKVPPTNVRKLRDERNQLFYNRFKEDRRARAVAVTADLSA